MKKQAKSKPRRSTKSRKTVPAARKRPAGEQLVRRAVVEPRTSRPPQRPAAAVIALALPAYTAEDRSALGLLLLPFMVVAMSLGLSHTLKPAGRWLPVLAERPAVEAPATPRPTAVARAPETAPLSPLAYPPLRPSIPPAAREQALPPAAVELPGRLATYPPAAPNVDVPQPTTNALPPPVVTLPGRIATLPLPLPTIVLPQPTERLATWSPPAPPLVLDRSPPVISQPVAPQPSIPQPAIATADDVGVCRPSSPLEISRGRTAARLPMHRSGDPEAFGRAIAAAARAQTSEFVIYTARYQQIAYPMGDLATLHGACTDVVIRAYRALGIDLQQLVQRTRVGGGDTNIDHRRTETLRRFFQVHGEMKALSPYPEDYKPGDIVTYYRPFSRVSRAHIAIVSDVIAPSGRPMIIHNRGYGPQLEDALFVDRITGHYRYSGPEAEPQVADGPRPADRAQPASAAPIPSPRQRTASVPAKVK